MSLYKGRKKLTPKEAKTQWDSARMCIQNEQEMLLWYDANILKENKSIMDNMILQMFQEEGGVEYHLKKIEYCKEKMKYCEQFFEVENV